MTRIAVLLVLASLLTAGSCEQGPRYADCDTARAAGAAPLHKGQPGYRPELDRNNNGVACEE